MLEAVEGAAVEEGEGIGLRLEADFYSVEGVFNVFSCYAGDLKCC